MPKKQSYRLRIITYFLALLVIILTIALVVTIRELRELESRIVTEKVPETVPEEISAVGTLAIIIDDFGYRNDSVSAGFLNLETQLTFSIIPGHAHSQTFARKAAAAGYEVIAHMPMESHTLTHGEEEFVLATTMTSAKIEQRIEKVFTALPQAVGMNNHQGSKATENKRVMQVLASTLKRQGKYFIDSRTTRNTIAESMMRKMNVPTNRRHVFLDNEFDPALIREQLDQLVLLARTNGVAIGVGHAKLNTLRVLQDRIPELKRKGFQFEFVSNVVH